MRGWTVAVALMLAGCQSASASRSDAVVLLGDDARVALAQGGACPMPAASRFQAPPAGATADQVADTAMKAKHGVIVMDAASGPLQVTREHILIARQARVPSLSVLVVNTHLLDSFPDRDALIEQQVAEVRQLLDKYEMQGASVAVSYGCPGLAEIAASANTMPARADAPEMLEAAELFVTVYLVTPAESRATRALAQGDAVNVWLAGQTFTGEVRSTGRIEPGGVGELRIRPVSPVRSRAGERLLLENDGRIVAAGVVMR